MLSTVIASASIVVISLLFGLGLVVAWREFGLQRHVASWALGFMAAAAGHGLRIAGGLMPSQVGLFAMLACHASIASFALLAVGFRQRAARDMRLICVIWLASLVVLTWAWLAQGVDWRMISRVVTGVADAALVAVIVATLRSRRRVGRIARWIFVAYGLYAAGVALAAWMARPGGELSEKAFIAVLSIGTPTGMIGTGIMTLLIVSADLAYGWRHQARTDALTGLLNRRGLDEDAAAVLGAVTDGRERALFVVDLDHFKAINDRLGHAGGDDVLKRFADHLRASVDENDLVARTGGEEFVLLLRNLAVGEAMKKADAIRASAPLSADETEALRRIPASFGVAIVGLDETFSDALARADAALYRSKREGRDRTTLG